MPSTRLNAILLTLLAVVWTVLHVPGVLYGTQNTPLHISYVGDEQSPVNGALHMLNERSILGLQNVPTLYYGPVFAVIATPAVVADFIVAVTSDGVRTAQAYRDRVIWDWGGIVIWARITVVLASILGFYFMYKVLMTHTCNPSQSSILALSGTTLVALNYYYFQYSHFFKHWIFVLVILLIQVYLTILLFETDGKNISHWISHGVLGVAGFGISYISMLFYVAFIPTAICLWRIGEDARTRLVKYVLLVSAGGLAVILWHPHAFIRYLGFLGVGQSTGGLGDTQSPLGTGESSWAYYAVEIIWNHLPVLLALTILIITLRKTKTLRLTTWAWILGSMAVINLFLFAPSEHHEGRYMLPTIVMTLLVTAVLLMQYFCSPHRSRWVTWSVVTLLVIYGIYHIAHVGRWVYVYAQGPAEKNMIEEVLALQRSTDKPVALVQSYIAGHVHTREAYRAYIEKRGREDVNLYKAIMGTSLPEDVEPLDVRYIWPQEYEQDPSVVDGYEVVYKLENRRPDELNQFDYMDENLLRLWYWDELMPRYMRIK